MRFAEEIVAASFVPTWRSLLARALDQRGLNQTEIALLLGVSQSAVSKHLAGKLGADERLANEPRMVAAVERVADGLRTRTMSPFEALAAGEALVREFEDRGPICRIHEEEMPSLQGLGCDLCVRVGGSDLLPEQSALTDLRAALRVLENAPGLAALLPHVGSNLARALPGAKSVESVAAVPGALFEMRGIVKVPAPPEFGVSRHVARILLAAMREHPTALACLNLTPAPRLLDAAREAGLRVVQVPAALERDPERLELAASGDAGDGRSEDGSEARPPDLFWHEGAFGIEPQAYLLGPTARELALRVRELAARV